MGDQRQDGEFPCRHEVPLSIAAIIGTNGLYIGWFMGLPGGNIVQMQETYQPWN